MNLHGFNEAIKHVITKTLEIFLFQKHPLVVLVIVILVLDVCIFFFAKKIKKNKKGNSLYSLQITKVYDSGSFFCRISNCKKTKVNF